MGAVLRHFPQLEVVLGTAACLAQIVASDKDYSDFQHDRTRGEDTE